MVVWGSRDTLRSSIVSVVLAICSWDWDIPKDYKLEFVALRHTLYAGTNVDGQTRRFVMTCSLRFFDYCLLLDIIIAVIATGKISAS